jgi:hypothetical protein
MNQYFSFAFGHAHFTIISTEDPIDPGTSQHRWLNYDLSHATSHKFVFPKGFRLRPVELMTAMFLDTNNGILNYSKAQWFIVIGHRPPWSSSDKKWTHTKAPVLRQKLEPMLLQYNVSLAMFGHIHAYERSTLVGGKTMYAIAGTGGSAIDDKWIEPMPEDCRARISEFGYCLLTIKVCWCCSLPMCLLLQIQLTKGVVFCRPRQRWLSRFTALKRMSTSMRLL